MEINFKSPNICFVNLLQIAFLFVIVFLFIKAIDYYSGEVYVYLIFTITSSTLLYFGFRERAIFFDTFIGIFFWLGFWLKLTVYIVYMDGQFREAVGNFDGSASAMDETLVVASCGFSGIIAASIFREKFIFVYPDLIKSGPGYGLFYLYERYRKPILFGFLILCVTLAASNIYLGIYQRGSISSTVIPYGVNGIYKWLLLFGLASISSVILNFEYILRERKTYLVAIVALLESFSSNISMLSRGMIINVGALGVGFIRGLKAYKLKIHPRFFAILFIIVVISFSISVVIVGYLRAKSFYTHELGDVQKGLVARDRENLQDGLNMQMFAENISKQTGRLLLDRWVGIEGLLAVSSHPNLGWSLWNAAWMEKYSDHNATFYDNNIIDSPYKSVNRDKHHFISLPGIIAFCFYPGSIVFLFLCMFLISIFGSVLELFAFKLGGRNLILSALVAQVVAFRYSNFGYAPAQSYLLFGALFMNIIIIYLSDRILAWRKKACL